MIVTNPLVKTLNKHIYNENNLVIGYAQNNPPFLEKRAWKKSVG